MYSVNGVPLADPEWRWRLHRDSQRRAPVTVRSTQADVPGVDGVVPVYDEPLDQAVLSLELNVYGNEVEVENRVSFLRGLFASGGGPLQLERRDGLSTHARLASISDPVMTPNYARMSVVLSIPSGVWRGPEGTDELSVGTNTLLALAGGTRAVRDALVHITGPANNVVLTDEGSGAELRWTREVPENRQALLVLEDWRAGQGTVVGWDSATVNSSRNLENSGPQSSLYLLPLTPVALPTGTTQTRVKIEATGTGETTRFQIRSRPAYL